MATRIPDSSGGLAYLPTLDGWRAIAITMVLAVHAAPLTGVWAHFEPIRFQGYLGVDLFFAISGLLICSRLLHEEQLTGSLNLRHFYIRRCLRIFPAMYLYLAVIALLALIKVVPVDWEAWDSALFFLRNYFTCFVRDTSIARFTGHFWSLAIEEHFYLLLPSLLFFFPRRRKLVLTGLVVLCLLWLIFYLKITPLANRQLYWERRTDLRLNSLLFPALLALLLQDKVARAWITRLTRPALLSASLLVLFFAQYARHNLISPPAAVYATATRPTTIQQSVIPAPPNIDVEAAREPHKELQFHPVATFLVPFLFPFLILATMLHPESLPSRVLEWAPLRALGRVSYSLYLWQQLFWIGTPYLHWPIRHLQRPITGAILTATATAASYWFVEKPIIRFGHRLTGRDRSQQLGDVSALHRREIEVSSPVG